MALVTADFSVYEKMVDELRRRKAPFITLRLGEQIPAGVKAIVTTEQEAGRIDWEGEHMIIYDEPASTADRAFGAITGSPPSDHIVIGIDPGRRPGIAVLSGDIVIAVHQVGVPEVEPLIKRVAKDAGAKSVLVRIGHGARLVTTQLINALVMSGFTVELVDETGTTPFIGRNIHTSMVRDILAAINIARIKGVHVGRQDVEPTRGEIRVIQQSSREISEGRSTIPRYLARQVARGELTIDEAIEIHRSTIRNHYTGDENGEVGQR